MVTVTSISSLCAENRSFILDSIWATRWSCSCTACEIGDTAADRTAWKIFLIDISIVFIVCSNMGWSEAGNISMADCCCSMGAGRVKGATLCAAEASSSILVLLFTGLAVVGEQGGENSSFLANGGEEREWHKEVLRVFPDPSWLLLGHVAGKKWVSMWGLPAAFWQRWWPVQFVGFVLGCCGATKEPRLSKGLKLSCHPLCR